MSAASFPGSHAQEPGNEVEMSAAGRLYWMESASNCLLFSLAKPAAFRFTWNEEPRLPSVFVDSN